jgi:hypothetical protein
MQKIGNTFSSVNDQLALGNILVLVIILILFPGIKVNSTIV